MKCETDAENEWRLAMICAQFFWHGTSITEGAMAIIEQARATPQLTGEHKERER